MTLIDRSSELAQVAQIVLSEEEVAARQDLAHLFESVVGPEVEIIGVEAAMWPFYRSEMQERITLPRYETEKGPEIRVFDKALLLGCVFAIRGKTHLYNADPWINYHNRLD